MVGVSGEDWISDDPITAARSNQKSVTVKATAPSTLYDGMHWVDSSTDPPTVKWYDLTSTTWYCDIQARAAVLSAGLTVGGAAIPDSVNDHALGSATAEFSDLFLGDGSIIYLGNDQDVTLTHVADTGILLNAAMRFEFRDATIYIASLDASYLDLVAAGIRLTGSVTCSSAVNIQGTTDATSKDTGALILEGGIGLEKSIFAGGGLTVGSSIVSDTQDTDSLGSATKEWLNLYIGDAGKIYLGLAQDVSLNRSAANVLTITASSGVVCSAGLTVGDGQSIILRGTTEKVWSSQAGYLDVNGASAFEVNIGGAALYLFDNARIYPNSNGTLNLGVSAALDFGTIFYHTLSPDSLLAGKEIIKRFSGEEIVGLVSKFPLLVNHKWVTSGKRGYSLIAEECPEETWLRDENGEFGGLDWGSLVNIALSSIPISFSRLAELDVKIQALEKDRDEIKRKLGLT